jgi:protein-L-isoaspartate(D-aspartate) O-methyltransferase
MNKALIKATSLAILSVGFFMALWAAAPRAALAIDAATTAALDRMVDDEVVETGIKNPRVIAAMRTTPRAEFTPPDQRKFAYFDMAVPLGHGQSISPPFVVAYMTEKLDPQPNEKALEIGTGSGYQAAVLSPLVKDVYTIEIKEPLGKRAAETLKRLGYKNVHTRIGDGYKGWPEAAPFDRIIVTCSPENVPQALVDQLREGGRLIVPVGERFQQTLYRFDKINGKLKAQPLEATMFVPMTGQAENERKVLPDGTKPVLLGGDFEKIAPATGFPEPWYYLRHGRVVEDPTAPSGKHVLTFENDVPGRSARILQAFAIDGRVISQLDVTLKVRAKKVHPGNEPEQIPRYIVWFFNEERSPIGEDAIGGWTGTFGWREQHGTIRVPPQARMAICWLGMLGATGEISYDDVSFKAVAVNPAQLPQKQPTTQKR